MGCKGVAQRMRRRALGQTERAAQLRHRQLHDARRERSPPCPDEKRSVGAKLEWACRDIVGDQFGNLRKHWHHAALVALSGNSQSIAAGVVLALEAKRF